MGELEMMEEEIHSLEAEKESNKNKVVSVSSRIGKCSKFYCFKDC